MKSVRILFITFILAGCSGCGFVIRHQQKSSDNIESNAMVQDAVQEEALPDTVYISRTWSNPEDWFCSAPSAEKIQEWKAICEKCNDGRVSRNYLKQFADTVQYMTVTDLLNTLIFVSPDVPELGDDFIAWRLSEWDNSSDHRLTFDSEHDRFAYLHDYIMAVTLYETFSQMEINTLSILRERLFEMYTNEIRNTVYRNVPPNQKKLLQMEEGAWKRYSEAEWDAYDKIWRGCYYNSQPMEGSEFLLDVQVLRQISLLDFVYAITDSLDYTTEGHRWSLICGMYEPDRHEDFTMRIVDAEYDRFMSVLQEDEYSYPLDIQKKALSRNRKA